MILPSFDMEIAWPNLEAFPSSTSIVANNSKFETLDSLLWINTLPISLFNVPPSEYATTLPLPETARPLDKYAFSLEPTNCLTSSAFPNPLINETSTVASSEVLSTEFET